MLRYLDIIRTIVCFLCLFSFIWGCDKQPEAPPTPKVITKKIVSQKAVMPPKTPPKIELAKAEIKPEASKPKVEPAPKETAAPKTPVSAAVTTAKPEAPGEKADEKAARKADEKLVSSLVAADQRLGLVAANVYNPEGRLDPFEPLFKDEPAAAPVVPTKKKTVKKRKPQTPLERVDLSQLKLVGIIRAVSGNKALVQEASGKGYIVKKGTYIGINSGKIVDILSDRIIVAEEVEDVFGKVSIKNKPLKIQKPPGE
jgi:type IV pilus assembly protein PilP